MNKKDTKVDPVVNDAARETILKNSPRGEVIEHKALIINGQINKELLCDLYNEGLKRKAEDCKQFMLLKLVEAAMKGSRECTLSTDVRIYSNDVIDVALDSLRNEGYGAEKLRSSASRTECHISF